MKFTYIAEAGFGLTETEVPLDEIQKTKNEGALKLMSSYGRPDQLEGLYTVHDPSKIELLGAFSTPNKYFMTLQFEPCWQSEDPNCASEDDVRAYLSDNLLGIYGAKNFINMRDVLPEQESIQQMPSSLIRYKVDLDKPTQK